MARKKSPTLTEAELRLMQVLWDRGESTVAEVHGALGEPPLAYNTVLTTMRILERKGYAAHRSEGRAFVYEAVVGRDEARSSVVDYVLSRFFDNSPRALMLKLLDASEIDDAEAARIRALLARGDAAAERADEEGSR